MQQALRVGKRAHAETGIDKAGQSVVTAALDVAAGAPAATLDRPTGAGDRRRRDGRAVRGHADPGRRRAAADHQPQRASGPTGSPRRTARPPCPSTDLDRRAAPRSTWSSPPPRRPSRCSPGPAWRDARPLVVLDLAVPRDVGAGRRRHRRRDRDRHRRAGRRPAGAAGRGRDRRRRADRRRRGGALPRLAARRRHRADRRRAAHPGRRRGRRRAAQARPRAGRNSPRSSGRMFPVRCTGSSSSCCTRRPCGSGSWPPSPAAISTRRCCVSCSTWTSRHATQADAVPEIGGSSVRTSAAPRHPGQRAGARPVADRSPTR